MELSFGVFGVLSSKNITNIISIFFLQKSHRRRAREIKRGGGGDKL